jgi:predicted nucleotidyltransferase
MDPQPIQLQQNHQMILDRFMTSCESDERVAAAFIGGSHARGQVDAYSDLDLYLITTDGKYEDFLGGREAFIHLLGKPLFLEDFGEP